MGSPTPTPVCRLISLSTQLVRANKYPVVAVRTPHLVPYYHTVVLTTSQVTIIQVDAADDKAELFPCHQARVSCDEKNE